MQNKRKRKRKTITTAAHEYVKQYNETVHTVTIFTPSYLLSGMNDSILPKKLRKEKSTEDLCKDRRIAVQISIKYHKYNKKNLMKKEKIMNSESGTLYT